MAPAARWPNWVRHARVRGGGDGVTNLQQGSQPPRGPSLAPDTEAPGALRWGIWMPGPVAELLGRTREEVGAAVVVNPVLRQSQVTAPWVQEFADACPQAAADESAAADSPSDASSARTPIPAADQAVVQAALGAIAPAHAGLDDLVDLASTAKI
ncbi:unnamed protein product [Phytophthora fragariaefolia]|uniref:Unnamed protein product n=1 Tax=Phytophthora fragariaefolia TaxID=1490495 RepID=A0A9W6WVL8_9STRA|nr:unnamed protein product [Phytophthora fragariaefolia]